MSPRQKRILTCNGTLELARDIDSDDARALNHRVRRFMEGQLDVAINTETCEFWFGRWAIDSPAVSKNVELERRQTVEKVKHKPSETLASTCAIMLAMLIAVLDL